MNNQVARDYMEIEDEEFPEEFQCCVCLDIMYKPVVLACGHISCFWCVFQAMDTYQDSHCPVCRKSYHHFPRICELLHLLLLKLYPSLYKRRELQVAEEEKEFGHTSPQLDNQLSEVLNPQHSPSPPPKAIPAVESNGMSGVDHLFIQDSSKRICSGEENTSAPIPSSSHMTNGVFEHKKLDLETDLQCNVCKQLLCRPVVLNCGHVYCQACIDPHNSVCKCPKCQSALPNGCPGVCLVLEHFIEERFPEEYAARKESIRNSQSVNPSKGSGEKQEQDTQSSSSPKNDNPCFSATHGPQFHPGVGCDYCGMYPIIGKRYRCKDCKEQIGFDLCGNCYSSSSKQPGRFNQQHTPEHQFELLPSDIFSLGANEVTPGNPEGYVYFTTYYSSGDEDLEVIASSVNGRWNLDDNNNTTYSTSDHHSDDEPEGVTAPSVNDAMDSNNNGSNS